MIDRNLLVGILIGLALGGTLSFLMLQSNLIKPVTTTKFKTRHTTLHHYATRYVTESFTSTFSVGLPDPCSDEETILIIEMEGHNAEDLQSKSFHLDVAEAIRLSAYIIFQYGEAARHFGVKLYRVGEKYPVFLMYTDSMGLQYFYYVAPTEGEYYFKIDSINADWSLNVFKCVNP